MRAAWRWLVRQMVLIGTSAAVFLGGLAIIPLVVVLLGLGFATFVSFAGALTSLLGVVLLGSGAAVKASLIYAACGIGAFAAMIAIMDLIASAWSALRRAGGREDVPFNA